MSGLKRAIKQRRARVDAHHDQLRRDLDHFNESLGQRIAQPHWLFAGFGAGFLAARMRGRRAQQAEQPAQEQDQQGESMLGGLIRQYGIPFAMNLLQQYLAARQAPEPEAPDEPPPAD